MLLFLANRLINDAYNKSFTIAQTPSEIILGSIGKFCFENTLLFCDIKLFNIGVIVANDMYRYIKNKYSIKSNEQQFKNMPTNADKNKDIFTIPLRAIGGFCIMSYIFFSIYPLCLTIPISSTRIFTSIYKKRLYVLK